LAKLGDPGERPGGAAEAGITIVGEGEGKGGLAGAAGLKGGDTLAQKHLGLGARVVAPGGRPDQHEGGQGIIFRAEEKPGRARDADVGEDEEQGGGPEQAAPKRAHLGGGHGATRGRAGAEHDERAHPAETRGAAPAQTSFAARAGAELIVAGVLARCGAARTAQAVKGFAGIPAQHREGQAQAVGHGIGAGGPERGGRGHGDSGARSEERGARNQKSEARS
jgi:hypothetical protein